MYNLDLFSALEESPINIINYDGTVEYHGLLIPFDEANYFFDILLNTIQWKHDQANILGEVIVTKRKVAWYANESFNYTYSNMTKVALPWTPELLVLKKRVEEATGHQFNSCLLNLYSTGEEGMAWHNDSETDLQKNGAIASLSFGAERKFSFKHRVNQDTKSIFLQHGSLLVMKGATQTHWLHRLPPTKKVTTARINLTFRTIDQNY
ncbi:alpha-ketoglutarate-dependent dioxygenase AlkB [uncultured Psychromonas sp.]|uniref:alpha-ketoglutarate-dependent dioxygenase AlkB family protein n=1 Tax=uncultured Psychromonas sp. TaxID=173974 RepID=UPI002624B257|nr:alpha-ketoglutarate-dependent dioxygenase AlkB [uncultured Psychromonas sp.]